MAENDMSTGGTDQPDCPDCGSDLRCSTFTGPGALICDDCGYREEAFGA